MAICYEKKILSYCCLILLVIDFAVGRNLSIKSPVLNANYCHICH